MKLRVCLIGLATAGSVAMQAAAAEGPIALKDQQDKTSYSIGMQVGAGIRQQMQQQGIDVKADILAAGFKDALSGAKPLLTEQEVRETLTLLERQMVGKRAEMAEKNKQEGDAFLAENKKKPGIKILPSGLQYQVIKQGNGQKPKASDTVKAHYKGTLINGTEFDSSEKRGEPATFPLTNVIPGWTEALQLMPIGSKWRLFIPAELAYGDRGAAPQIGPNATLIFDVELLGIDSSAKPLN
jgi:FKBP-type peptidyl-prolyl cis-trans isomerase FklB